MRRRLLLLFLALVASVVVIVATVPLWLGFAAKLGGRSRGFTFGAYERIGYSRFVLRDVEYRRPGLRVTATRAEADTPLLWWWHRWNNRPELVTAGEWQVEVLRLDPSQPVPSAPPAPDRGWMKLNRLLQRIATQLGRWLPRANVGAGVVRWPGGELALAGAKWAGREIAVDDFTYRSLKVDGTVAFVPDEDRLRVAAKLEDGSAAVRLESRGPDVKGDFSFWDQAASFTARFNPAGWLPGEAALRANEWTIPGERVKLGTAYARVRGSGTIEWRAGEFLGEVNVTGEPLPGKPAPPLEVALRGKGDMQAFTIHSLNASLPGVNALLSAPVTVERSGRIRESAARFTLTADLAKVPWFTATGQVTGDARLVSGISASPVVEFAVNASGVRARDVELSSVAARGRFDWPRVQISDGTLVAGAGERLVWSGGWDIRAKEILAASLEGEIRRTSLARWLPKQPEFETVKLSARAEGPVASFQHRGTAHAAGVKAQGINPLDVAAEWSGRGAAVDSFKVEAKAGTSSFLAIGRADATSITLSTLDFVQGGAPRLQLVAPAVVSWRPNLRVESLRLAGPEGRLSVAATMGEVGRLDVAAHNVARSWLSDLLVLPGPSWTVSLLALTGTWNRGPMSFSLATGARVEIGDARVATVNIAARGDKEGIRIEALRATEADATVVNATGRLPFSVSPGGSSLFHIDPNGALLLDATVAPNSAFWQKLATLSGVDLKEPQAAAHLTGTWRQPEGNASLRAASITIDPKRVARPLPSIESLDVELTGDRGGVTLRTFALKIEGQAVKGSGRLPVPEGQWDELFKEPLAAARKDADLRLEVPDAEVAVFTRFLPAVLAPKGRLQADVRYRNGGLEGFLRLRDAASRPLGPLGVLQEVSAEIVLSGRTFALRGVTAKSGGQPVTLQGTIDLPERGSPRFDLSLQGTNLPFVRQTGLLVRGDLDLKLQTPQGAEPRLSGTVRLRDSLFLSDVRSFLPKGGASAARRPPYFAIETPPVNTWTLAVDVVGEQFLRLRTPVFVGVASARFRLGGTLAEPRAIGELEVEEGNVRMPFASFAVTQGSVRLTEADPYEPAIYVRGTTRRYNYDLTMEIDGTASAPNVVFTSSPPLDSEQVVLLVMAGIVPSNEITKSATQRVANIGLFLSQGFLGSLSSDGADADRLTFTSGEKISRQGKETYDVEYKLTDRWTITGERNEFDEYNAGVKWRVWGGKQTLEKKAKDNAKK